MIFTTHRPEFYWNTDYANALIKAAAELRQHTGDERLDEPIRIAEQARDEYGEVLWSTPEPGHDKQDVLASMYTPHLRFVHALQDLERVMRFAGND